MQAARPKQFQA